MKINVAASLVHTLLASLDASLDASLGASLGASLASRVGEYDAEDEVGDIEVLAPKQPVNVLS